MYRYRQLVPEELRYLYRSCHSHYSKIVLGHYWKLSQLHSNQVWRFISHAFGFWQPRNMTHQKKDGVADFSAIWWPILKKIGEMLGDHITHKHTKFCQNPLMYANLRPKIPGRWASFCHNRPPDRVWKHNCWRRTSRKVGNWTITLKIRYEKASWNYAFKLG